MCGALDARGVLTGCGAALPRDAGVRRIGDGVRGVRPERSKPLGLLPPPASGSRGLAPGARALGLGSAVRPARAGPLGLGEAWSPRAPGAIARAAAVVLLRE
jgi:hypothetical protein